MKEHLFFIEVNLPPPASNYKAMAEKYKNEFEQLLMETVYYSCGVVPMDAYYWDEFVTPYTLKAEEITSKLTGACIDTDITKSELELREHSSENYPMYELDSFVCDLNNRSLDLLGNVIEFQKKLLCLKSECKIFISIYDHMLEHVTREAEYYEVLLKALQEGEIPRKTLCDVLDFWNNIMSEHAKFVDGMLDPTEKNLKDKAKLFAKKFEELVKECIEYREREILNESLECTDELQEFKEAAVQGLLSCNIKSIIPPLLADHVLREANHYLKLLKTYCRYLYND